MLYAVFRSFSLAEYLAGYPAGYPAFLITEYPAEYPAAGYRISKKGRNIRPAGYPEHPYRRVKTIEYGSGSTRRLSMVPISIRNTSNYHCFEIIRQKISLNTMFKTSVSDPHLLLSGSGSWSQFFSLWIRIRWDVKGANKKIKKIYHKSLIKTIFCNLTLKKLNSNINLNLVLHSNVNVVLVFYCLFHVSKP